MIINFLKFFWDGGSKRKYLPDIADICVTSMTKSVYVQSETNFLLAGSLSDEACLSSLSKRIKTFSSTKKIIIKQIKFGCC